MYINVVRLLFARTHKRPQQCFSSTVFLFHGTSLTHNECPRNDIISTRDFNISGFLETMQTYYGLSSLHGRRPKVDFVPHMISSPLGRRPKVNYVPNIIRNNEDVLTSPWLPGTSTTTRPQPRLLTLSSCIALLSHRRPRSQ